MKVSIGRREERRKGVHLIIGTRSEMEFLVTLRICRMHTMNRRSRINNIITLPILFVSLIMSGTEKLHIYKNNTNDMYTSTAGARREEVEYCFR